MFHVFEGEDMVGKNLVRKKFCTCVPPSRPCQLCSTLRNSGTLEQIGLFPYISMGWVFRCFGATEQGGNLLIISDKLNV